jgi:Ca2+-binding EF-hand superfamily protein
MVFQPGIPFDEPKFKEVFSKLDADGSGALSIDEFQAIKNPPFIDTFKPLTEKLLA